MKNFLVRLLHYAALWRGPGLAGRLQRGWRMYRKSGWRGVQWELGRRLGGHNNYAVWVGRYDTLDDPVRERIRSRVAAMADPPRIAVVMPTYNPNPAWLREAIESVRAQLYPHWELCIADDASTVGDIKDLLRDYAARDSRIKLVLREKNGHISAASNSALELVTAPWVALMDHDDLLPEHALFWVADAIEKQPQAQLIYSDEDKIDAGGHRFGPYFKCDWNIDLFRSQNMFSHLGVFSTELMRAVGGFRVGLEGSQDWDLVLRCIERLGAAQHQADQAGLANQLTAAKAAEAPERIVHIPRVLYHWRVHSESTARSMAAKPYAALAGERALNEHFARTGVDAWAEHVGFGYRAHYALPAEPPRVSIIIPTRNAERLVRQCIESIRSKTTYPDYEIVLVDNGSDDASALAYFAELARLPNLRVLRDDRPFNYSALNNGAVKVATGDLLALVNNDIEVITPEWLSEMASLALQPGVGAVGARLWYPGMLLQHAGIVLGLGGMAAHAHRGMPQGREGYGGRAALIQSFSAVTAACLVVKKSIYLQLGGFDEAHLTVAFNDVDFCLRVRDAGYRNVWTPYAQLLHHESATRGEDASPEKKARFAAEMATMRERWGPLLDRDPAYSPNLMLAREDFSYAWPPRVEPA